MIRRAKRITDTWLRLALVFLMCTAGVITALAFFPQEWIHRIALVIAAGIFLLGMVVIYIIPTITGVLVIGANIPGVRYVLRPIKYVLIPWFWCIFYGFCVWLLHTDQNPIGVLVVGVATILLPYLYSLSWGWLKIARPIISAVLVFQLVQMTNFHQDIYGPVRDQVVRLWTGGDVTQIRQKRLEMEDIAEAKREADLSLKKTAREIERDAWSKYSEKVVVAKEQGKPLPPAPTPYPVATPVVALAPFHLVPGSYRDLNGTFNVLAVQENGAWIRFTAETGTGEIAHLEWRRDETSGTAWFINPSVSPTRTDRRSKGSHINIRWVSERFRWEGEDREGSFEIFPR